MRFKTLTLLVTFTILLAVPDQLTAQSSEEHRGHHRYKLIDIGLGGPQSAVFEFAHTLSNRGAVVGMAETPAADPNYPNFSPFVGFGNPDRFVQHGFLWQDGVLTDMGALALTAVKSLRSTREE
jgi:hypothetical protein